MKPLIRSIIILAILLFISCSKNSKVESAINDEVIITGKANNFITEITQVKFRIQNLVMKEDKVIVPIDSTGNFRIIFDSNYEREVVLNFGENRINIITHPGDSVHIIIDGKSDSIKFHGDGAKTNNEIYLFKKIYSSINFMDYWSINPDKDPEKYLSNIDSIKNNCAELLQEFISKNKPTEETITWATITIENDFFYNLFGYPLAHQINVNKWEIPKGFLAEINNMMPIKKGMFSSTYSLNHLIGNIRYLLIQKANSIYDFQKYSEKEVDSLIIHTIISGCSDTMIYQLILTKHFSDRLETYGTKLIENNRTVIDEYIKVPILKNSLLKLYSEIKTITNNPQINTQTILNKIEGKSIKNLLDSLLSSNKGKVIYIDCWATWCVPCIREIPNSIELMKKYSSENVEFIFMCIRSEEKTWKAILSKYQMGGNHYLLNEKQSDEFTSTFNISGIPTYILINENGEIVNENAPKPSELTDEIDILLK